MKVISEMGEAYLVSDMVFKKVLGLMAADNREEATRVLADKGKNLGKVVNITDMDGYQAQEALDYHAKKKGAILG